MVALHEVATRFSAPGGYLLSLSDLVLADTGGGLRLYSASAQGGGVLTLDPGAGLAIRAQTPFATGGMDAPRQLHLAPDGAGLYALGRQGTLVEGFAIAADGRAVDAPDLAQAGAGIEVGAAVASALVAAGGRQFIVMANRGERGLDVWEMTEGNRLARVVQSAGVDTGTATSGAREITAMATVTQGAETWVLTLSGGQDSLSVMRVSADGQLTRGPRMQAEDGLILNDATVIETVTAGGRTFAILGAAGSGTLAVVEFANGGIALRDQVLDELGTRFAGVTALATAVLDGQIYVAAGGSDDGVSLMTLLPDGRLVHLATLADGLTTALDNPGALAMAARAGGLDLFVAGGGAQGGISQLRAELGAIGVTQRLSDAGHGVTGTGGRDQIIGGAGADTLRGGAGDDILADGGGDDRLEGGAGADLFILCRDGVADVIADFEAGIDRLDLGDLGRFHTAEAIGYTRTATGAELRIGDERVILISADGRPIEARDLAIGALRDLTHLPITPPPPPGSDPPPPDPDRRLTGTANADRLEGGTGRDTIEGAGGADRLAGGAGDDMLLGGTVRAVWDATAAQVFRLYQATLDRAPDAGGLLAWHAALTAGTSLVEVAAGFVGSREFQRVYGALDDADFVTLLYRNVLGRDPDAGGLAYWTGLLESGARSRPAVVAGFSDSPEFRQSSALAALSHATEALRMAQSDDVFRLYRATLGRDPDTAGFLDWSARLADGLAYRTAVAGFVGSREFQAVYGALDDRAFVTLLYRNVLDRAPDAAGLAHWTGHLAAGTRDRAQVVEAFAQSLEFTRATARPLIDWMRGRGMDDVLDGGAGNDVLTGGLFADTFVFRAGEAGTDRVLGFEAWDQVAFQGFGFGDAAAVRAAMVQAGSDVVFDRGGLRVIFENTRLDLFSDDVFLF
jgi:Ca2+-binding RTX toxin-like protein